MDMGEELRYTTRDNIDDLGEPVTVKHLTKSGVDTYRQGTYDDVVQTISCNMIITLQRVTAQRVEEGAIQNAVWKGECRDDVLIQRDDIVVRADGSEMTVINHWVHQPFGTPVANFVTMRGSTTPKGTYDQ